MKIYTGKGDKGITSTISKKVLKDDILIEFLGTLDEVNAFLGSVISQMNNRKFQDIILDLTNIQIKIFDIGVEIAQLENKKEESIKIATIKNLEQLIDSYSKECQPLRRFILPGGSKEASFLHITRTITRRAERRFVSLQKKHKNCNKNILIYLNRLSDFFFVLSRVINKRKNIKETEYIKKEEKEKK